MYNFVYKVFENNNYYILKICFFDMGKRVRKTERHIRWNWEQSPDMKDVDGRDGVRFHFVIVDDRDRPGILNKILAPLRNAGEIKIIRSIDGGKVLNSKNQYLFVSADTIAAPNLLELSGLGKPAKKDGDLRERQRGSVEDYVANVYCS
jgi:hypothetical protein